MTDLDERIHADLERLVSQAPLPPSVEEILVARPTLDRRRRRRRRRRPALVGVAAATITLLVAASIVLVQSNRDRSSQVTASGDSTAPFTDVAPDSTLPLPSPPLSERSVPTVVWTGTEIIVWGGLGSDGASLDDGAAYRPATGTWRVLAPAGLRGRAFAAAVWTGTEVIVWGGQHRDGTTTDGGATFTSALLADSAAYDPVTDRWRRLPAAPIQPAVEPHAVWTGDEVIVLGGELGNQAAAYDPALNRWRRLADAPEVGDSRGLSAPVWTGATLLQVSLDAVPVLRRYDPRTEGWSVDDDAGYACLVGIPGADGVTPTLLGLPLDTGAPVEVLDDTGRPTDHLPEYPGGVAVMDEAEGFWLGDEARFWVRGDGWQLSDEGTEPWALSPETGIWRALPANTPSFSPDVVIGDVMFAWAEWPEGDAPRPVVYRAPTTSSD